MVPTRSWLTSITELPNRRLQVGHTGRSLEVCGVSESPVTVPMSQPGLPRNPRNESRNEHASVVSRYVEGDRLLRACQGPDGPVPRQLWNLSVRNGGPGAGPVVSERSDDDGRANRQPDQTLQAAAS